MRNSMNKWQISDCYWLHAIFAWKETRCAFILFFLFFNFCSNAQHSNIKVSRITLKLESEHQMINSVVHIIFTCGSFIFTFRRIFFLFFACESIIIVTQVLFWLLCISVWRHHLKFYSDDVNHVICLIESYESPLLIRHCCN